MTQNTFSLQLPQQLVRTSPLAGIRGVTDLSTGGSPFLQKNGTNYNSQVTEVVQRGESQPPSLAVLYRLSLYNSEPEEEVTLSYAQEVLSLGVLLLGPRAIYPSFWLQV